MIEKQVYTYVNYENPSSVLNVIAEGTPFAGFVNGDFVPHITPQLGIRTFNPESITPELGVTVNMSSGFAMATYYDRNGSDRRAEPLVSWQVMNMLPRISHVDPSTLKLLNDIADTHERNVLLENLRNNESDIQTIRRLYGIRLKDVVDLWEYSRSDEVREGYMEIAPRIRNALRAHGIRYVPDLDMHAEGIAV